MPKRTTAASVIDRHVAGRLRAARMAAGLSQETAAAHLNLTFQQLQKYEKGANRISAGKLAMLANIYHQPIEWFFDGLELNGVGKPDIVGTLLSQPYGADLARDYVSIKHNTDRHIVASVAAALARQG